MIYPELSQVGAVIENLCHFPSLTCTKPRDTPAKCANCQGEHPANYKGCQTLKDLRNMRKPFQRPAPAQPVQMPPRLEEFPYLRQTSQCSPPATDLQQPGTSTGPQPLNQRRPAAARPVLQHQPAMSGMGSGITQPVPPMVNGSSQIIEMINNLNNLIHPLFNLLQQFSQFTQVWCATYAH